MLRTNCLKIKKADGQTTYTDIQACKQTDRQTNQQFKHLKKTNKFSFRSNHYQTDDHNVSEHSEKAVSPKCINKPTNKQTEKD